MFPFQFRHCVYNRAIHKRTFSGVSESIHQSQKASLGDSLIQVDKKDNILGPVPKLDSHLAAAIISGTVHRAFSVFLFSKSDNSLLIQKRSEHKIVFPRQWANTCCSHPLYTDEEMENFDGNQIGIKRAAVKRLGVELGLANFGVSNLCFKEKILYRQLSPGGTFGESECDYILLGQVDETTSPTTPNQEELEGTIWIQPGSVGERTKLLKEFLETQRLQGFPPTPWFELMVKEADCLESWWSQLIQGREQFFKKEDVRSGEIRDMF